MPAPAAEPSARARELVRGAYDLHVHIEPDLAKRRIDDLGLARRFKELGDRLKEKFTGVEIQRTMFGISRIRFAHEDRPVSVPDFFATICAAVGVDYRASLYDGDRPVPITDQGTPIEELFG